ncbi:dsDNA nuclease domain-containing protein [Acinetobacter nematophilus]|uniref:DsDNA nuclease domain-containing protein n=1 Tax=Acinetobacter nematophilus TaxID=2994642 RepID=A0A9X3DUZ9_9GAMM|nr:dsDNA nuclease domain-containing protein [Acinetobacter nematophilus]MCX5468868.1 dsDNA nuclease domain-containing protein [Acinetobacter nematophilus]
MKNLNILNDDERENKGLDTSLRFEYQIDWAIYHALDKLSQNQEFVVFVEFHEDVLFANSCVFNPSIKFELFQIKTTYKSYTPKSITNVGQTNSILGKMIIGVKDKIFENYVDKLCLLCLEDINFSDKIQETDKDYRFSQLQEHDKKIIANAISSELNFYINSQYEDMIIFRKTGLKLDNSDSHIKHKIYDFIENNYGDVSSRPNSIYRLLKDDLRPKSKHKQRYEYWEDCVKHRGLESKKISEDILKNTDRDIEPELKKIIESQLIEEGEDTMKIARILKKIRDYYLFKLCLKPAAVQTELDQFLDELVLPLDIDDKTTYWKSIDLLDKKVNKYLSLKEYNKFRAVAIYEVFGMLYEQF